MKVLFLTLEFPLPADRGLRVRELSQLRLMAGMESVEQITFLSLSMYPIPGGELRALERELPKVRVETPVLQPAELKKHPALFRRFLRCKFLEGQPYLVARIDSAEMRQRIDALLRATKYDVVYVGFLPFTIYVPQIRALSPDTRIVLGQHNVEWEIFQRLAPSLRAPKRQLAHLEAYALRRFERKALRDADAVVAISQADARAFQAMAGVDATVVAPAVVRAPPRVETTAAPRLCYVGQLAWQPNAYGLDWFCRDIWPLVLRELPDAKLTIAGTGLKQKDGALDVPANWQVPGVETIGFVRDLEDLYRGAVGMIAPVIGGSGVRMKLVEAMNAGMPTVTTTDGAAGLAVADGREVLIADAAPDFAKGVVRLLREPALRASLRQAGYDFLTAQHSEAALRRKFELALTPARPRQRVLPALAPQRT